MKARIASVLLYYYLLDASVLLYIVPEQVDCTFSFQGTSFECVPALDFIKRLIVHIPEKHYKLLRYYGIYAKHHKQEKKSADVFLLKSANFYIPFRAGAIPSFSALAMIRFVALTVVLPCRFWKFTT